MTSQPSHAHPILTNDSDGTNLMYPYTTPNSAKTSKKDNKDGVLNLLNIPDGVNIDNLSKPHNGNLYSTEDFVTEPSTSNKPTSPQGLEAPSVYKEIQRTTADKDSSIEDSTVGTDGTTDNGAKLNLTTSVQNDKTTIVPYNLNEDDSDIDYEVDVSEVELLKTTGKQNNDEKEFEVEEKRGKKKNSQDRDRKQKKRKKGKNNSSKYLFRCIILSV